MGSRHLAIIGSVCLDGERRLGGSKILQSSIMEREFFEHCEDDNLEGVNDCLSRGVDANTNGQGNITGLILACDAGNSAIVSRLVQVPGLDIDHQTEDGWTA